MIYFFAMQSGQLPKDHQLFSVFNDIQQICAPIRRFFHIAHFSYVKVNSDLSRIHLDTSPDWIDQFYKNAEGYYQNGGMTEGKHWESSYTLLHFLQDERECIIDAKQFNIGNGVVIAEHDATGTELCFFALADNDKQHFMHLSRLVNHIDLLKKFMVYFKEQAKTHIEDAQKNHLIKLPYLMPQEKIETLTYDDFSPVEFMRMLGENTEENLTPRELDCAHFLLQGMAPKEIAGNMGISARTLEKHLSHLRQKTNSKSTIHLLAKLKNYVDHRH